MYQPERMDGKIFGKFKHRPRLNIFFGVFVKDAYQPETDFKKDVFHVCCHVRYVIIIMRTNGIFFFIEMTTYKQRKRRGWNKLSRHTYSSATTQEREPGRSLGIKARLMWEEWNSVNQLQQRHQIADQQQQPLVWQKPSTGWHKCNIDAGFHKDLNKTSFSWCLRDHLGRFVMAGTMWKEGNFSVVEGESTALLYAMQEMERRGFFHVIFETDSKSV
ncbi:hypothetical protein TSUD_400550 [Trifolium subterraneum]|uniref:RNase H type-1 domain-containing protein n=1 Tax=Trifolium subterraneum TaxID=3900 RepID=A0A2Z6P860_TRISU|nr:hypothetical protein TSUD_400550 [Trifolium subterraneum]